MGQGPSSPFFYIEGDDAEMARAMARARSTFKYLWRELTWEYRRIIPGLEVSAVKVAFKDDDDESGRVEHMWLGDVEFDGELIKAKLLNAPNELNSVREGDEISLRLDQLEDWMYVMHGEVFGAFTVQVLRGRMGASERRAHDKAWGFEFPEPGRVELVPNWKAREKKRSFLGGLFGGAPPPADPDAEHPMSENVAPTLAEEIERNRDAFLSVGEAGLSTLHSLALGGSAACVKVLLEAGADPQQKTRSGRTALELAKMMDWPRVVKLLLPN